jgi:hypothetical protein
MPAQAAAPVRKKRIQILLGTWKFAQFFILPYRRCDDQILLPVLLLK